MKKKIMKNINQIGIIFNTDPHYKEGSHWVCMFIDLEKNYIFYFDSNGDEPCDEINVFIDRLLLQCKEMNKSMNVYNNKNNKHQYSDGECGMYALYTIISLLEKKHNVSYFKHKKIPDKKMNDYRKIFFNEI